MPTKPFTKEQANLPPEWEKWAKRGKPSPTHRRRAVLKCMNPETKEVRGWYSALPLNPNLPPTHSLYPSVEHTTHPKDHSEIVLESRIVNDMKSHLSGKEFWHAIEHLCRVGIDKGKIPQTPQRRDDWSPARHYEKQNQTGLIHETKQAVTK